MASLVYQRHIGVDFMGFRTSNALSCVFQFLLQQPLERQVVEDYLVLVSLIFLLLLSPKPCGG